MSDAWHKPVLFGLCGLLGGLAAAALGEAWVRAATPPPPPPRRPPSLDIVFVLDVTGSMQPAIDGVRDGIVSFVSGLEGKALDARVALVSFRDRHPLDKGGDGEDPVTHDFGDGPFTKDAKAFREKAAALRATGGGDFPESSLDALAQAARLRFRPGAKRVLMLITDATPKVPDKDTPTVEAAARVLKENAIDQFHLVAPESALDVDGTPAKGPDGKAVPVKAAYEPLQKETPGEWFRLEYGTAARRGFDEVLPRAGEAIAERTLKGVQGTTEVAEKDAWQLVLSVAVWTALVGLGVAVALQVGQNGYLRRPLLSVAALGGGLAGLVAGLASGAAGQGLFQYGAEAAGHEALARVASWTLLGLLLGLGTSLGVPNLGLARGAAGGLLGGLVGVGVFLGLSALGEVPARLGGAAGLGLSVGLLIGVAEASFRQAWLEVAYGPRETRLVALGSETVRVGAGPGCTVVAYGATNELRFRLADGKVTCQDGQAGRPKEARPGDSWRVGRLTVIVRAAGAAAAPDPAPPARDPFDLPTVMASGGPSLRLDGGRVLPLAEGRPVTAADLPGLVPASGTAVADLTRNPKDPTALGLRNLTRRPWRVRLPDSTTREVEPQRSVRLVAGTRIDFGPFSAEVRD